MLYRVLPRACVVIAALATTAGAFAVPASAKFGDRALREGDHGRHVRVLQRWMKVVGYPIKVDGAYGGKTTRMVRRFERDNEMRVDGRVSRLQARGLRKRVIQARIAAAATAPPPPVLGFTNTPNAVLAPDGVIALVPVSAPPQVRDAIIAANRIVTKPYRYGGGHNASFEDSAYDCSGTISYALHGGGLLDSPLASGGFMRYGEAGKGAWITTYANRGHAYVVIAGLRLDTSGTGGKGPRWQTKKRSAKRYEVRHPPGL